MIPYHIKNPVPFPTNPIEVQQLDDFLKSKSLLTNNDNIQITFSKRQWQLLCAVNSSFLWLVSLLSIKKVGIEIIRKVLNISLPSSKDKNNDNSNADNNGADIGPQDSEKKIENNGDKEQINETANTDPITNPNNKKRVNENHDGKRNSDDFTDAKIINHDRTDLKSGDLCPNTDCTGRVYPFLRDGKSREVVTFNFTAPFQPTVHQMNDLRCNLCFTLFKVPLPDELIADGALEGWVLYPAQVALVLLHYGFGMPMHRLDHFQSLVGERFPESTQFDIFEKHANAFSRLTDAMERCAANGFLLQGDDVSNRIQNMDVELRERRSDKKIVVREGVHTSLLIATTNDGHLIPILKTGIIHFGELLDQILSKRDLNLAPPQVICDGSKVNKNFVGVCVIGGCWQHARDYFIKALPHFPQECSPFKDLIKKVFKIDRETHGMDASERLEYLKGNALPVVKIIKELVDTSLDSKIVLPKSTLGEALSYFHDQYDKLLLPFQNEGVPLHNNISEWCTYLIVRLTANSKFYKTEAGAVIGDKIIMVILFCYLSLINPYDYMLYCLRHKKEMKENPENFFPWKLREQVKAMPESKQMKFWSPSPPNKKEVAQLQL